MTMQPGTGIAEREDVAWRRRLLVFGQSIRSDFDNPEALTWRALMRSLTHAGHEVIFIEPRRGASLTSLLRHRGSAPLRQFADRFPDIQYRTLDLPRRRELEVWLTRELALIDAVVVLDDASPEIRTIVDDYAEPGLIRFTAGGRDERSERAGATSVTMVPVGQATDDAVADARILRIGPAVALPDGVRPWGAGQPRLAVLAWDASDGDLAERTRRAVQEQGLDADAYSLGTLSLPGWKPVTTLDIDTVLSGAGLAVIVVGPGIEPSHAAAHALLPWSSGVRSVTVLDSDAGAPAGLPGATIVIDQLARSLGDAASMPDPDLSAWSADAQASELISWLDRARDRARLRS